MSTLAVLLWDTSLGYSAPISFAVGMDTVAWVRVHYINGRTQYPGLESPLAGLLGMEDTVDWVGCCP